jgi:hypothetical protein
MVQLGKMQLLEYWLMPMKNIVGDRFFRTAIHSIIYIPKHK